MILVFLFIFSDFFPSEEATTHENGSERLLINAGNNFISLCLFNGLNFEMGKGGAIFADSSGKTVIERCIFINCSSKSGGAIKLSGGSSVISMTCGSFCTAPSTYWGDGGQFCDVNALSGCSIRLIITSVLKCPHISSTGTEVAIGIRGGMQTIENSNSSFNTARSISGILFNQLESSECNFCSFINSTTINWCCILYINNANPASFSNSNVVGNLSPDKQWGVFYAERSAPVSISLCVFGMNNDILLTTFESTLSVKNSWISHSGTLLYKFSGVISLEGSVQYIPTYMISVMRFDCSSYIKHEMTSNIRKYKTHISILFAILQ